MSNQLINATIIFMGWRENDSDITGEREKLQSVDKSSVLIRFVVDVSSCLRYEEHF